MIIAVDIGNSFVKISHSIEKRKIKKYFSGDKIKNYKADNFIISSVNPNLEKQVFKKLKGRKHKILASKIKEINFNFYDLSKLGSDRIASMFGVYCDYGPGSMIVDFGTAITIDYLSSRAEYRGGMILPGPYSMLEVLNEKTALIKEKDYNIFLDFGKNTSECVNSAVTNSIIGMIEKAISKTKEQKRNIIFTGGYSEMFLKFFKNAIHEPDIVLNGLFYYGRKYIEEK